MTAVDRRWHEFIYYLQSLILYMDSEYRISYEGFMQWFSNFAVEMIARCKV